MDGGVLGQDGDAALALEVGVVHRALGDALVGAEDAALVQQGVHERGLAVVDVGDDGDVAAERVGDGRRGSSGARASYQYTSGQDSARQVRRPDCTDTRPSSEGERPQFFTSNGSHRGGTVSDC